MSASTSSAYRPTTSSKLDRLFLGAKKPARASGWQVIGCQPDEIGLGFKAALAYKGVRLCVDEAEQLGAPMVVGSAVREMLAITLAAIGKDADYSEVVKVYEAWAGVEVRG